MFIISALHQNNRKRRSLDNNVIILPDDGEDNTYDYNPEDFLHDKTSIFNKIEISESQARFACTNAIFNSTSGRVCMEAIKDFNISSFIIQCTIDAVV